jgi:dephospho-CoA kinase
MSILIGLTGNIGSGKSLTASYFKELGAYIIDADLISRELVIPDQPAWKEIVDKFGNEYLNPDKTLNRSKLAVEVFQSTKKRRALEAILHHRVIAEEKNIYLDHQKIDPEAVVIIDSALLIESQNYKNVAKVIIVQSTQELQIQRVMTRDGESRASVKNRLKSQMSLEGKLNYADYVLDNTSGRDLLKSQVHRLYSEFKSLALSKI